MNSVNIMDSRRLPKLAFYYKSEGYRDTGRPLRIGMKSEEA